MRCLVAGGAGFVGSNLVDRLLAEGHSVDVVDDLSTGTLSNLADARADRSNDLTIHRLDVYDPLTADLLLRRRPDVVFHLLPAPEPARFAALLGFVGAAGVAKIVVVLEAADLYEPVAAGSPPSREGDAGRPGPVGEAAKRVVQALTTARADSGQEFTVLALSSVCGPRQHDRTTVGALMARVAAGRAGGSAPAARPVVHDLLYIDDAVDALVRAVGAGGGLLINVGSGVATSDAEILAAIDGNEVALPPADGATGLRLDRARASMQLGWEPWTPAAAAVAASVRANSERPDA